MKIPSAVLSVLCLVTLIVSGCSKSKEATQQVDIYAFGTVGKVVTYWKNGTPVSLTDGTSNELPTSMYITGNDVYITGQSISKSGISVAKYWMNGLAYDLTDGTRNACAYGITVYGGAHKYITGYEAWSPPNGSSSNLEAKYWVDGDDYGLVDGSIFNASATGLAFSGSDLHIIGGVRINKTWDGVIKNQTPDSVVAMYWKNGVVIPLAHNAKYSYANAISISGSDVYIAGSEVNPNKKKAAKYWKNGAEIDLTDGINDADANGIAIVDSDVYVAGFNNGVATLWKNGIATSLTFDPTKFTKAVSISVASGSVYVVGQAYNGNNEHLGSYLWKDGITVAPFLGADPSTKLYGVIAVRR